MVGWLVVWLVGWFVGWLVDSLVGWLVGWMVVWLVSWLNGWLVCWLVVVSTIFQLSSVSFLCLVKSRWWSTRKPLLLRPPYTFFNLYCNYIICTFLSMLT